MNGTDMVNHPQHYKSKSGLEVIDVIKAFTADLKGYQATDTGNIIKYILRWRYKNGLEDLKKAQWYLNDLITTIEKEEGQKPDPKATAAPIDQHINTDIRCPQCHKGLIRLEPYKVSEYDYWCDDCNILIQVTKANEIEKENEQ